jgi:AcrR family transcriptional regulator
VPTRPRETEDTIRSVVRTHPPREARREAIRDDLAEAIERLFDQGLSYAEISVGRLCEEAGTTRATFYQYFTDKGDLLQQLAEASLHALGDTTEFWWHLPRGSGRRELRHAFESTFALYREHHGVMASLTETAAHDRAMRSHLNTVVAWAIDETTAHIEEGISGGSINPDLDPKITARWLCWMFERGLYDVAARSGQDMLESMLDAVTGLIWNALYRPVQ